MSNPDTHVETNQGQLVVYGKTGEGMHVQSSMMFVYGDQFK